MGPDKEVPTTGKSSIKTNSKSSMNIEQPTIKEASRSNLLENMHQTASDRQLGTSSIQPAMISPVSTRHLSLAREAGNTNQLPTNSANNQVTNDTASQLRSTLAIGQLIASNRPTAGSRLIANEMRQLSNTIKEESVSLRKEIATLSTNLASTLKVVLEEEREQRNMSIRRPVFGQLPYRRFPVYRRPRRISLQFSRKSLSNASTNTSPPQGLQSPNLSSVSRPSNENQSSGLNANSTTNKQATAASKSPAISDSASTKTIPTIFKNPWMTSDQNSYDGEVDTESTDTSPSSTP